MQVSDDSEGPSPVQQVGVAVAIAALSALTAGLINWGIDELRTKFGSKSKDNKQS